MQRRIPLKAKTQLRGKSQLKRTALRKKSKKQKAYDAELESMRPIIRERDKESCILCGKGYEEIHHIKARSSGGTNDLENLCCLCWHCKRIKIHNGIYPKEYRKMLQQILKERYGYEY